VPFASVGPVEHRRGNGEEVAGRSQPLWLAFDETGEREEDLAARRVCPALLAAVDPEARFLDGEDLSTIEPGGSHMRG
jgi:hypothetical protein